MKALVLAESLWGNTASVADAIAEGLGEVAQVERCGVEDAPAVPAADVDLVVVGGPTHAFSMSRPSTRHDAAERGATHPSDTGVREWLEQLPHEGLTARFATFDTHVKQRWVPGSASASAAREARHHHLHVVAGESFLVAGYEGPLLDGELDRARAWGRQLAELVGT